MTAFLDTGALYGTLDRSDEHHLDAVSLVYQALKGKWGRVYTSNYVEIEATLLLGSRLGPSAARAVPSFLSKSGFKELLVDGPTHAKAVDLFIRDERLSLTDASSVLLMGVVGAKALLGFDTRSFAGRNVEVVGGGHWERLSDSEKKGVGAFERGSGKAP
ncbi:MAG: PIN domain-containing protein [Nitrososphaerota archaeon]|jgi:predicted nucleic acid-binding protein|nr:PIN domain-containing protein [Nitrososphaerota archaeon]MDG6909677.1 PIN domain-containing protein [Nitrososphaerota archaeon]MDG6913231.1 PIN domain-containing protein [Nitrososphaerota archaeon]MDG6937519.1 PIN domain-containing protein [Nitrososphaerota archaeon]MDG6961661.1 PIN domain-containing protein [Nitrososphaerota archaeon]